MSRTYINTTLRREVIERAKHCCEYCKIHQDDQFFTFEIDHIIAEKHGGLTGSNNLALSCPECNAFKGSDIASIDWANDERVVPLFHPRRQDWNEHFLIDIQTGKIIGQTPVGKVTTQLLQINIEERVKDRQLLIAEGRYPTSDQPSTHAP